MSKAKPETLAAVELSADEIGALIQLVNGQVQQNPIGALMVPTLKKLDEAYKGLREADTDGA